MLIDRHDDLFRRQTELARGRVEDAGIGLVRHDPVDIGGGQARRASSTSPITAGEVDDRVAKHLAPLHPHLADRAGGRGAAIDIEQFVVPPVGMEPRREDAAPASSVRCPSSTIAPAPSPNSTQVRAVFPVEDAAERLRADHQRARARRPRGSCCRRPAARRGSPSRPPRRRTRRNRRCRASPAPWSRWPERSGRASRSRARSGRCRAPRIPAAASAARHASAASVAVVSSGPAMWRKRMPVRSTIHSSDVSTSCASSAFDTRRAGQRRAGAGDDARRIMPRSSPALSSKCREILARSGA